MSTEPVEHLNLEPGFHANIKAEDYHADKLCGVPTLSRSLGEMLLSEAPVHAYYAHPRLGLADVPKFGGEKDATDEMDFGSLGHTLLLGKGSEIVVGEWANWQTNAAKDFRKEARAAKQTPVLAKTWARGLAMKEHAMRHLERLGYLQQFLEAQSEVVALFDDGDVRCRVMFDKIHRATGTIFDLKITGSGNPKVLERQIVNMSYDLQDVFYRTAFQRLEPKLAGREKFIFFFIEDRFPFCVTPIELSGAFRTNGASKYNHALGIWRKCMALNQWPHYTDKIVKVEPPAWALNAEFGREMPKFNEPRPGADVPPPSA